MLCGFQCQVRSVVGQLTPPYELALAMVRAVMIYVSVSADIAGPASRVAIKGAKK